jgi:predicted ribosome quality control (RQC) complex YloA/Tae2 family protein
LEAGLNPKSKCEEFDIEASLVPLWNQFQEVSKFVADPERSKGFVTWKENKNPATTLSNGQVLEVNKDDVLYDAFIPKLFKQFVDTPKMEFEDFDAAADEFFSKIESQKIEVQRSHQENSVVKKLDKVKEDQNKRIKALEDQEDKWERYASLIEQNVHAVDAAINAVNSYLEKQIQWTQLTDMVKQLKKQGDPIASLIHKMDLLKSKVTLLLYDTITAEEDLELEAEQVTVDLKLTAHANATEYYAQKKKAAEKKQKTMESARHALKSAEKTAISQLKEVKMKASIQKLRKPYWFERFNWFVSSDGYIVVSGRDMQQNEVHVISLSFEHPPITLTNSCDSS